MYIIKNKIDLLDAEVNEFMDNFTPTQIKSLDREVRPFSYVNEYTKQFINPSNDLINLLKNMIMSYFPNHEVNYYYSRLNKVEKDTNYSDGFHTDMGTGNVIILHYPKTNPHFVGGQFEWKNNNDVSEIVEIENGMNIMIIDNPPHRVLNVTEGCRYSFAFFFDRYKIRGVI